MTIKFGKSEEIKHLKTETILEGKKITALTKPDFMNAGSARSWSEVATVRFWDAKIQYFYVILRKTGHGMEFSSLCSSEFCKIIYVIGTKSCFVK